MSNNSPDIPRMFPNESDFVKPISNVFKCSICTNILKQPMQTKCGCRFCYDCIQQYLKKDTKSCPNGQPECEDILLSLNKNIYFDRAMLKEIMELEVKCPVQRCSKQCSLKNILHHFIECQFPNIELCSKYFNINQNELNARVNDGNVLNIIVGLTKNVEKDEKDINHLKEMMKECYKTLKLICHHISLQSGSETQNATSINTSVLLPVTYPVRPFKDGYLLKIRNYSNLCFDAINQTASFFITSDSFYLGEIGFEMCLRVYPLGNGVGRNTHLSVFFSIIKGDYVDVVPWPFKQKVTLSLLSQDGTQQHYSDTIEPETRPTCFTESTDDPEFYWGSSQFYLLSTLSSSKFYKKDSIYIKMAIDKNMQHL